MGMCQLICILQELTTLGSTTVNILILLLFGFAIECMQSKHILCSMLSVLFLQTVIMVLFVII